MHKAFHLLPLLGLLALAGCNETAVKTAIQPSLCEINTLEAGWDTCKEGQIMAFLPQFFGNEQLPVVAAALYCDFHYPIVYTAGGVSCVFTAARKPQPSADTKGDDQAREQDASPKQEKQR